MLRIRVMILTCAVLATSLVGLGRPPAATAGNTDGTLVAYLDGRLIPLSDVGRYFCDDFSYPIIECSRIALGIELRAAVASLLTSVTYVTVYEFTGYAGPYMHISQDYPVLATIGWNDRISSFRAKNGEAGRFWTDWFYGGSMWNFCCNTTMSSLGSWNNTFSSVHRL